MITAREQARQAAVKDRPRHWTDAKQGADAASDVWEPILRELVEAVGAAPLGGCPNDDRDKIHRLISSWAAARRALGIED